MMSTSACGRSRSAVVACRVSVSTSHSHFCRALAPLASDRFRRSRWDHDDSGGRDCSPVAHTCTLSSVDETLDPDDIRRVLTAAHLYYVQDRTMEAIARDRGIRSAYFIQPIPAVGKRLTPEERAVVGDLSYAPLYRRMVDEMLGLRAERVPIFSLLDVFADVETALYDDSIHLKRNERGESMGYQLMATAIARRLADVWHLRSKR